MFIQFLRRMANVVNVNYPHQVEKQNYMYHHGNERGQ